MIDAKAQDRLAAAAGSLRARLLGPDAVGGWVQGSYQGYRFIPYGCPAGGPLHNDGRVLSRKDRQYTVPPCRPSDYLVLGCGVQGPGLKRKTGQLP